MEKQPTGQAVEVVSTGPAVCVPLPSYVPCIYLSSSNRSLKDNLSRDLGSPTGSAEAQLRSWNQLDSLLHVWGGTLLR